MRTTRENHWLTDRILLGRGHLLDRERIVKQTVAREILNDVFLH